MKKSLLILIIIFLIISPSLVYASTTYGEYQEYLMNTDEYIEESDTLKREEIKLYNTYEIKSIDLGYEKECSKRDENDTIEEEYEYADKVDGSIGYQAVLALDKKVQGFSFFDFGKKTKIYELNVYDGDQKINYSFYAHYQEKYKYIFDDDLNTYAEVYLNDKISIFLKSIVSKDLKIEIIGEDINCTGYFSFSNKLNGASFVKINAHNIYFVDNQTAEKIKEKYGFVVHYYTDAAGNTFESLNPFYVKKEKKYHCYGTEKVILNNYVSNGDNLIYDDYITRYNYYIRSKNEVEDNVVKSVNVKKKIKKKKTTTTKIEENKNENINEEKEEIIQVEPLFNEAVEKEHKFNFKFVILVILIIITLQIIIFTLHRKK